MTTGPVVSVVMSVSNCEEKVRDSVQSVLSQEGVDLEFIIVDDGSTDDTPRLLEEIGSRDRRIRVIRQPNQGLTLALIRGCSEARGQLIARQDCGDLSLPGRLCAQVGTMASHPDAALVSCGTRFVGPGDELLYEISSDNQDATAGLLATDLEHFRGPSCHPCTMFRRNLYQDAGGYRREFYFAQDLDLWTRLAERGRHLTSPEILYQAGFSPGGISGMHRKQQVESARILLECARLRRAGLSESSALDNAKAIVPEAGGSGPADRAPALYFVGMCLRKRGDPRATGYFRDALRANPFHLKSALRLLLR